jgi:hypothetical protein
MYSDEWAEWTLRVGKTVVLVVAFLGLVRAAKGILKNSPKGLFSKSDRKA